jgi:hypothetical protein
VRRVLIAALCLLALAGCKTDKKVATTPTATPGIEGVVTYSDLSQRHLDKGQYDITYPQSPPVGGAHSPYWLKCQAYTSELPKVNAVHSLEHGAVWVTYLPSTTAAVVAQLDQLVGLNTEYVLVSPYSGQDSPIVLSAWGAQLKVTDAADPRIAAFVRAYAGNGPEKGVTCASSGATLEQALSYDAQQK